MFKIGDVVFWACNEMKKRYVKCPECFGKKYLTVIMGDDSQVTVDCVACGGGVHNGSSGVIETYDYEICVVKKIITGMEVSPVKTEYKSHTHCDTVCSSWVTLKEEDIFLTEPEAVARASILKSIQEKEEAERLTQKQDHRRTWSWNAHYHRDCIRRANKDLAYHTAKLEVAKTHVKEDVTKE